MGNSAPQALGENAPAAPQRAVIYTRMSTDHQQYSTENQLNYINNYARQKDMRVIREYSDGGKSGLCIDGRDALKQLLDDTHDPQRDFDAILVFDVSRWGRFQDVDESAYYEYICKREGVKVLYCAEDFINDDTPEAAAMKGFKRSMAAIYSRDLSRKVFIGQCHLIHLGFRQGGPAGYGLRRILIDQSGNVKSELARGEHKSIQTDRVILAPGPPDEISVVRRIYHLFVNTGMTERAIADTLNAEGIWTDLGRPWTSSTIHQVLTNEKYIGNNVYNRTSQKLKSKKRIINSPDMYIRADGVFEAIVATELFVAAQQIIQTRTRRYSDDELVSQLREILEKHGRLSALIIDEYEGAPSSAVFRNRFGSLIRAYRMVGYEPVHDCAFIEINRRLRDIHPGVVEHIVTEMRKQGAHVERDPISDLLTINGEFTVSLVISRCRTTPRGIHRWIIRLENSLLPDITVAVRMDPENTYPIDYYLMPAMGITSERITMTDANGLLFDAFRHESLDFLIGMAKRISILEVA